MIDLHLHVLPGVDDGASDEKMARSMIARLAQMGFTQLVATPHLMEPLSDEYHQLTTQAHDQLQPVAVEHGLSLSLGYEHMLVPDLDRRLRGGEPSTMANSNAVLVELPFIGWPRHTESSLFQLRTSGYRPILAHPERYVEVQRNPELALAAARQGVVLQLTSGSFSGIYGRSAERTAKTLLEDGLDRDALIVLSTDVHSDGQRMGGVPAGIQWIRKHLDRGTQVVEWSARVVPALLLADGPLMAFDEWASAQGPTPADNGTRNGARQERGLRRALSWTTRSRGT